MEQVTEKVKEGEGQPSSTSTPTKQPRKKKDAVAIVVEQQHGVIQVPPTIDELIGWAVKNNYDLDKLQRLLDMKAEHDRKQARRSFFDALTSFQAECPEILRSRPVKYTSQRTGQTTDYKYSDLGAIDRVIKPVMMKHGLSKRWEFKDVPNPEGEKLPQWTEVTCVVTHKDGHEERTTMKGPKDDSGGKNAIQSSGSSLTYMQRYTLIGALGLTTAQVDDDGRAAGKGPATGQGNEPTEDLQGITSDSRLPYPTPEAFENLKARIKSGKGTTADAAKTLYLTPTQIRECLTLEPKKPA